MTYAGGSSQPQGDPSPLLSPLFPRACPGSNWFVLPTWSLRDSFTGRDGTPSTDLNKRLSESRESQVRCTRAVSRLRTTYHSRTYITLQRKYPRCASLSSAKSKSTTAISSVVTSNQVLNMNLPRNPGVFLSQSKDCSSNNHISHPGSPRADVPPRVVIDKTQTRFVQTHAEQDGRRVRNVQVPSTGLGVLGLDPDF